LTIMPPSPHGAATPRSIIIIFYFGAFFCGLGKKKGDLKDRLFLFK
jgi:hypothetical protein